VGNAYIIGDTFSTDFPLQNPFQANHHANPHCQLCRDVFVSKLNETGEALVYSTYLGGGRTKNGIAIVVDIEGHAYVTGETHSSDFPIVNPFQSAPTGSSDAFVAKFNHDTDTLLYSIFRGSSEQDRGHAIAVDAKGHAYVIDHTLSASFPEVNTLMDQPSGCEIIVQVQFNTFVIKLDPTGSTLSYSLCLGHGVGRATAVNASGLVVIAGYTCSPTFPQVNPIQVAFGRAVRCFCRAGRYHRLQFTFLQLSCRRKTRHGFKYCSGFRG